VDKSDLMDQVAAIVLAGGQGTRLDPLTRNRAKPSVGFGGRYRLIDIPLSNALNSKITNLFVISQYFASQIHEHICATYRLDFLRKGGIQLLCPEKEGKEQEWFAGTADAIRKNLHYLLKAPVDYFLILSGDQLYNMDLGDLVRFAIDKQAKMVVASLYVQENEAKRMGLMHVDRNFCIQDFQEKPKEKKILEKFCDKKDRFLASMGIYVFRRDTLEELLKEPGHDFGHHLIPTQVARGGSYAYVYDGYWVDIGTIASFYEANMSLLERKHCLQAYNEAAPIYTRSYHLPSPFIAHSRILHSYISQGSIIEADAISHSILGMRCHVKKGTTIKDSIVMGHQFYAPPLHQSPPLPAQFTIGENCVIEKAIIDEHTCIGNRVRLVNEKHLQTYDGEGVCIRDGIIIVTSGSSLPDDFVL
jgi:glucose-1-phosphate adenylyltransferase